MNLLVLGGTKFLGRAIVSDALERGHAVTLFTRGMTNPGLFPDARHVRGDRLVSLEPLEGMKFDAVVDTSGYHPRPVAESARSIAAGLYCFVSTISVYADVPAAGVDESARTASIGGDVPEEYDPELYGPLKALCEQEVERAAGSSLLIRPGLIVGPHDHSDRFTYWPVRARRGGTILAPGRPERQVQVIDVRDLAAWTLDAVERGLTGPYNATGPAAPLTMAAMIDACRSAAATPSEVEWVDAAFLLAQGVAPWSDLPVWLPEEGEHAGLLGVDCSRAIEAGLSFRPVEQTARETLAWLDAESPGRDLVAGITAEREAEILRAWADRVGR